MVKNRELWGNPGGLEKLGKQENFIDCAEVSGKF
jgi:hypothetical protein